jgi:group I intron endonuclease
MLPQKRPGVYLIRNVTNNKVYVGSAARSIHERWTCHKWQLRHNKHENRHLQHAWGKYGEQAFEFIILESIENVDTILEREQFWLDLYMSRDRSACYNNSPTAGSCRGVKLSKETKERMRVAQTGKKYSDEARQKMSESGKLRPPPSDATRAKLSKALRGRRRTPETADKIAKTYAGLISPDGIAYPNIKNLHQFSRMRSLDPSSMRKVAVGELRQFRGWRHINSEPLIMLVYAFMSPDGIRHETACVSAFAREQGLNYRSLSSVHSGKRKSHKGWRKA